MCNKINPFSSTFMFPKGINHFGFNHTTYTVAILLVVCIVLGNEHRLLRFQEFSSGALDFYTSYKLCAQIYSMMTL